jgi:phytoene synthase
LCLAIFDARAQSATVQELADDLGIALQLTNILRDVREDAENGRVYLPREDLSRFGLIAPEERRAQQVLATLRHALGVPGAGPNGASGHGALAPLMRFEAERARQWFDRGIVLAGLLDRRSAACVLAMAGIYERLLERIAAQPEQAIARRVALAPWEKAWVAAGSMLAPDVRARRLRAGASEPIGGHR